MLILTEDVVIVCKHQLGTVQVPPTQQLVRVDKRLMLVEPNPVGQAIRGCPNIGPTIKPCTTTLKVDQGYSALMAIDGKRVCLDTVSGLTDGTPPGIVKYIVRSPGQTFVSATQ